MAIITRHKRLAWCVGWMETMILLIALGLTCVAQEASRKVVARTAPTYPELAKKMHLAGKVKLEVTISTGGAVTSAKQVGGSPVFEKNALEAVKQWRFEAGQKVTKEVVVLDFEDR